MKDILSRNDINICYLGEIDFDKGSAMAARIFNNAAAITYSGKFRVNLVGKGLQPCLAINGFSVLNVKVGKSIVIKLLLYIFRGFSIVRLLKNKAIQDQIIVYYGSSSLILLPLRRFCRKRKIKLVVDVVEWYDYTHLPFGKYGPAALNVHYAMTKLIPKVDGVIVISSFLKRYYEGKIKQVIQVPVLIDTKLHTNSIVAEDKSEDKLNLIYAGTPGKKDLIYNMIYAVEKTTNPNIKFHILGIEKHKLEQQMDVSLSDKIKCYGVIKQQQVYQSLMKADFSVLLRPNKRYANAGFPTKFVESITYGIPVIANLTSDLEKYLIDEFNGYIVEDDSIESLTIKLDDMAKLEEEDFRKLKTNARNMAVKSFDYRNFSADFDSFFDELLAH